MTEFHRSPEWKRLTRKMRPIYQGQVDAGQAVCVDCGAFIQPWETWAVGHIIPAHQRPDLALAEWNTGPTHHGKSSPNCNQKAGGRMGAQKTNSKRARAEGKEYPKWY
ncbi:hypothetical protein DOE76_13885 [Leifsonia sp. ku-ls]|nr:hypothetical protein DOE76_13885 [Leifsonia sp. ku-ls]